MRSGMQQQQPGTVTHSRINSLMISRRLTRPRVASRYSVRTSAILNNSPMSLPSYQSVVTIIMCLVYYISCHPIAAITIDCCWSCHTTKIRHNPLSIVDPSDKSLSAAEKHCSFSMSQKSRWDLLQGRNREWLLTYVLNTNRITCFSCCSFYSPTWAVWCQAAASHDKYEGHTPH